MVKRIKQGGQKIKTALLAPDLELNIPAYEGVMVVRGIE